MHRKSGIGKLALDEKKAKQLGSWPELISR